MSSAMPDGKPWLWVAMQARGVVLGAMPTFRDIDGVLWTMTAAQQGGATTPPPEPEPEPVPIGRLRVSGKYLVDETGLAWTGHGVNIMDTRGCNACTWSDPDADEVIRRMRYFLDQGATFFRLCLESYMRSDSGRSNTFNTPGYLDDIERIVDFAHSEGVQIMASLWIDETFDAGWVPTQDTYLNLAALGRRLEKYPNAWIGCSNEPTMNWDQADSARRHLVFTNCVKAIRDSGFSGLVAVQGLSGWGRDLSYYVTHPMTDHQVVYETHVYGPATDYTSQVTTSRNFGLPVILGEFGPVAGMMTQLDALAVGGQAIADGVTSAAWVGHHRCGAQSSILVDNSNGGCGVGMPLALTEWGTRLVELWVR